MLLFVVYCLHWHILYVDYDFNHSLTVSAAILPRDLTDREGFCGLMDQITQCLVPGTGYDNSKREVSVKHFQKIWR